MSWLPQGVPGGVVVSASFDGSIDLIAGVEASFAPTDEGNVSIEIVETNNDDSVVYSAEQSMDFYRSDQKVGTVANRIKEGLSDGIDPDAVGNAFRSLCSTLSANHEDVQSAWQPPIVTELLNQTQCVEVFGGNPTTFTVALKRNGREEELEFTTGEFMAPNPAPFRDKYGAVFYEKIDIEPEVWEELVDEWLEMKEVVGTERYSEEEATVDDLVDVLNSRLTPVDDREALANGTMSAWYDKGNSKGDADVIEAAEEENPDVFWVRTDALRDILTEIGKGREYLQRLSPTLRKTGTTYTTSKTVGAGGTTRKCFGFDPEAVGIPPEAVHSSDEEITEIEP